MGLTESVEHLLQHGALRVAETTPPIMAVTDHHDDNVAPAYERALCYPMLTLLGNLNEAPDVRALVMQAACDLTLRRRLIGWQEATGDMPPHPFNRYVGPTGY